MQPRACVSLLALCVAAIGAGAGAAPAAARIVQEEKRDRNDSIEVVARGCLKGRDLTADEVAGHAELEREIDAMFRLSGKGEIGRSIRRFDGRRVEVTGSVKKTALARRGLSLGGGRVVIGGGGVSRDPTRDPARSAERRLYPMDVTVITAIAESCTR